MSPPVSLCTLKCGSTIALHCIGNSNVLYLSVICQGDGEETSSFSTAERCSCRLVLHQWCMCACLSVYVRSKSTAAAVEAAGTSKSRPFRFFFFFFFLIARESSLASIHTPPLFHSSRLSCVSRFFLSLAPFTLSQANSTQSLREEGSEIHSLFLLV